ncbi:hypothetical protein A2382_05080 [Candidatus Woesebacteria bacterium RIFOXYB1_FULL_38_16]|uniref:Endolytic murein transglycosylase n=1 Tax=Candidatus Woesebacteria bacterium RIFOXYB1_FULL_38_16 TaxID=1802538 RepID=A0A1F8CWD5_9BACT|nr:MAG: hypothetical protein A2382_05080 [Candidatus Woesebacteria bacterium RIFOXYB1_FULL_38_16]
MKRISFFLTFILILGMIFVGGGVIWWRGVTGAASTETKTTSFLIVKGASAERIGQDLLKAGLIKNRLAFKIYLQTHNLTTAIPPGEFLIPRNLKLGELVDLLLKGPTEMWVTIPEGLRREEIVERFIDGLKMEDANAQVFRSEFLEESEDWEGFLYPDTYLFPRDVGAGQVVTRLKATFESKFGKNTGSSGLTLLEVVTLASIIERETLGSEERAIVAGVYMNRLNAGWALDADATVQYAVANVKCSIIPVDCDWWPRPLTKDDLLYNSSYNTYRNPGLPPGPIANPGLLSLTAVANPQKTDYWFYIHDGEGKIHFAKTLEEHNRNIQKYLR